MNRKITPWLMVAALLLGAATWWTRHARQADSRGGSNQSKGNRILAVESSALTQVRVRQDYWNSFTLVHRPSGSWDLVEPSAEPANQETVKRFLESLANLPALKTFDTPANDSERYRQYGLWSPKLTITAYTAARDYTIIFGIEAEDQSGAYCALKGKDEIHVAPLEAVRILTTELAAFRQSSGATNTSTIK